MARESLDIPHSMRKVYRRFERWRSAHTARLPIPERLWASAVELARKHGVSRTAQALHLEYGKLRRLVESASPVAKSRMVKAPAAGRRRSRSFAPPTFVELMAPRPGSLPGGVVELEGPRGRMRIELRGVTTAKLVALSRALWDGGA
jgi:hypothetical protein